jgi:hypothetical protein
MNGIARRQTTRFATLILPALLLAGCFGEGQGPDRIAGTPAPPKPEVPEGYCDAINFEPECPAVAFSDFEGGVITVEAVATLLPDVAAGNDSVNVGRMIKARAESGFTYGGSTMQLASAFEVEAGSSFTMQVYSTRSVRVLFQPEPQGPGSGVEVTHGGTGWEEMTFSLPALAGTVTGITLIFDNGTLGDFEADPANWTFYFDDITLVAGGGGGGAQVGLPVTFDDAAVDYDLVDFGDPVPVATTLVADPTDAANTVASTNKPAGTPTWAGTTIGGTTGLASAIPFTATETSMTVRVYSPDAGIPVRLKVEDASDDTISVETEALTTVANAWETLTFDFSVQAAGTAALDLANTYDKVSIFFNFGTDGDTAGDKTYLWDDVAFGGGGGGGGTAPTVAAPTPTQDAANVISMFSDAYVDVNVDTWRTDWSAATLAEVLIDGNPTKEYTGLDFVGIETVAAPLDVSGMTHFHMDIWTPDAESLLVKLVDFGGDGFGGGNDTEGPIVFDGAAGNQPAPAQGQWVSLDISLADMQAAGLANLTDINQLIIAATPAGTTTLYVDNVYFYNDSAGGGGDAPVVAAPTPTQDAADVISMFSDTYTDVTIDTWRTGWSVGDLTEVTIDGQQVKQYTNLDFVGVEAVANQIDASGMTHFHVDVWTPNATQLRIKLVDFGADAAFGGGDDTEGELVYDGTSTPALAQGQWISLDIPLADFQAAGLANLGHIAQLIFSAQPPGSATVYVTNVYFYNAGGGGGPTAPTAAAPVPTQAEADVISLFSDAYTDVAVDTWRTDWSVATLTDTDVAGDAVKLYTELNFVGIETVASQIDASGMTHFSIDVWTPDATQIRIKLVDFGADGAFDGGDDTEHEVTYDNPAQGQWISYDIPLTDFVNLTNRNNIAQLIISGLPAGAATLYVDNVYFYSEAPPTEPTAAAPTPTQDAANVISLFSGAYTDVPVDTWRTDWSAATLTDTDVAGDAVKLYTDLDFVGVETVLNQIDASGMTHFSIDVWTPDATQIRIKLVDFGADGAFDGGDDTEHEVTYDNPAQGQWISYDIPLTDFVNLTNRNNIAQLIISGLPAGATTLYIDNVYFYNDTGGGSGGTFVNGDFETGDFTGWTLTQVPDNRGSITLDSSGQGGRAGTVARLVASGDASSTNDVLISQVALAAGTIVTGDTIGVSFDLYGSLSGAGGVVFVEVIFLNGAGVDEGGRNFVGPAAPYTPTATWTTHSGTVIAGTGANSSGWDVSGGVTLQLKAACGAIVGGCGVDASFDNVTFTINGQ